jgi:hypothetical protein
MVLSANSSDRYWATAFVLLLLTLAVYQKALWFVPSSGDDLRILSSVSQTRNPLSYFATDWGMENTYRLGNGQIDSKRRSYRPLHSISIWLSYRIFGVSAFPNQLINLILHFVNGLLFLRILFRFGLDGFRAFLLTALAQVSLFTVSSAVWVSDRQTLVLGLVVVLLLDNVVDATGQLRTVLNPWLVTGLTLAGVFFQEGGLIVPLVAAAFIVLTPYIGPRWRHLAVCALLVASYFGLRVLLFGSNAFAYASEGYVFGNHPYTLFSDLSWYVGLWARFENVAKNFLCVFLPIFNSVGRLDSLNELIKNVFWWVPSLALAVYATRRPITKVQWLALAVIASNAALHMQVFRYRIGYVSQFAFCLYVAASPIWQTNRDGLLHRRQLAGFCCGLLALVSISQVNHYVHANWIERQDEMTKQRLATVLRNYPISPYIVQQVLARYANGRETIPITTP